MKQSADNKVWIWNANLAWELFSSAVYNYRLSLTTHREHQKHAFCKNVILDALTAVEAYFNEILAKEMGWTEGEIRKAKWRDKLVELGVDFSEVRFANSKFVRNNFIVHHKRNDYRYFVEINPGSALDAIESSQDIIAEVSFRKGRIFPYWITGLNFIDPSHANDIWLMNDYEFWSRFKWLGISKVVNGMLSPSGEIRPPTDRKTYNPLYRELWQKLKDSDFKLDILNRLKDRRFPLMPFLTSEWWVIDPPLDFQGYYEYFGNKS